MIKWWQGSRLAIAVLSVVLTAGASVQAASYTVVHTFSGADGGESVAGLMQARDGNFYGTTSVGGNAYVNFGTPGFGVVYQLTPSGTYTVLHNFTSGALSPNLDGQNPGCQLIQGLSTDNNLYGTTTNGGANGGGTLYQMPTDGSAFNVLESFTSDGSDGHPFGGVIDLSGVLWGASSNTTDYTTASGNGGIFNYNLGTGAYSVRFFSAAGGSTPVAPLILGQDGLLYGTGYYGGANNAGTIYEFDPTSFPTSNPTSFHDFGAPNDGSNPQGAVYQAPDGAFYVTTVFGGTGLTGTVAKYIFTAGVGYTNVWTTSFDNSAVWGPQAALMMASDGFLYGTTGAGGPAENGDIYKVDPATGAITDVYDFNGTTDGAQCQAPLLLGADGYLWGTTVTMGDPTAQMGTIFKFSLDPILTSISPTTVTAGNPGFTLTVNGADFNADSTVRWNGTALTTTYVSPTQLTAAVPSTVLGSIGTATIDVQNRDLATSGTATINIVAAPTITSINPTDVSATGPGFEMTITGTNFVDGDTVTIGGASGITPNTLNSTTITAAVPGFVVFSAGSVGVTVVTADGVSSNSATLTVHAPSISSLSPSAVTLGTTGFNLTINGAWFPQSSRVDIGGNFLAPTTITNNKIVVAVPGSDITAAGPLSVQIQTGDGPTSNIVNLQVNAAPTVASLSPTDVTAGHPDFTLTITGTNFLTGDTVSFGTESLTPTSLTSTQIQVTVPKADVATSGSVTVNVVTADGLTFGGLTFTVDAAPTITSLSPNELTAGHPDFTLTVTGTNFVSGDTVLFGTDTLTPPANTVTPTHIQVTVPAADIASPGSINVSVVSADGIASSTTAFTVDKAPTITSISPTDIAFNTLPFSLTITGTNFTATDTVNFGPYAGYAPISVSPTKIVVQPPYLSPGSYSVSVVTVDGVSSNSQSLTSHIPSLTSLSPGEVTAGNAGFNLTINGSYFVPNELVQFGTNDLTPTSATANQIVIAIPAAAVASPGPINVDFAWDGGATNTLTFTVLPAATITSISPANVTAGHPTFTLTITGSNFVKGDTVAFGTNTLTPTSLSATQIQVSVPNTDVATASTSSVSVVTADGVSSNAAPFTINAAPAITALSPSAVTAGHPSFTLTISGSGFAAGDTVSFGAATLTPTSISAAQIQVTVPAADVASSGPVAVHVVSGDGVSSNASTFTVDTAPSITGLRPSSATAGHPTFTLFVTGSNFVKNDVVVFGSDTLTPVALTATAIQVTVPAADAASASSVPVVVRTADSVDSNSVAFTVNAAPSVTSISPTDVTAGHASFSLTITGGNFAAGDQVAFGSDTLTPQAADITPTSITVTVPSTDVTATGTLPVAVVSSDSVSSNSVTFTVDTAPTLTSLNPNNANSGGADFTLAVIGANLGATDTVQWNGANLVTKFISATELDATVPAADIAVAGTAQVTAVTADGVSSNALTFTINLVNPRGGAPSITTISPASATAGDPAFTLTVTGTNFAAGDVVNWNGLPLSTTLVSATQLTAAVPASDIAIAGDQQVTVVDALGNSSNVVAFTVNAVHTFPTGLQLISVPFDYAGDPLSSVLGTTNPLIAVWDPVKFDYALTPTSPADTLHQGRGFWAHFHQPTGLVKKGTDLTTSMHLLSIPLSSGWNMIGDPYAVAIPLSSVVVVDGSGNRYSLTDANAKGLVYSVLYSYDPSSNSYVTHSGDSLQPYTGYWICAFADCTLEIPAN